MAKKKKKAAAPKRKAGRPPVLTGATDLKRAFQLRVEGRSYQEIADILGVTRQAIFYHLSPIFKMLGDTKGLKVYQKNKADILDGIQAQLSRRLLDEDKLDKATLGNVAYAIEKLNNIGRLERDQSTSNVLVAHMDAIKTVEQADAEIKRITDDISMVSDRAIKDTQYGKDESLEALEAEIQRIKTQDTDITDDPFEGID